MNTSKWKWVRHVTGVYLCVCYRDGERMEALGVVDDFGRIVFVG